MGCDLYSFLPHLCRQSLNVINARANGLYIDVTSILLRYQKKNTDELVSFIDIFVQKLQPTDFIFISFEGQSPIQKQIKKNNSLRLYKRQPLDKSEMFPIQKFTSSIKEKIISDPAWQKPKVILSSICSPGEAEHKIFSFIKTFNKNNGIKPEDNFINFIVTCDYDCVHLALANNLYNTYIITDLFDSKNAGASILSNRDEKIELKMFNSSSEYNYISIDIAREFLYQYMTGSNEKPDKMKLERVMNDFELLCLFMQNDFVYDNGFKYSMLRKYSYLFKKEEFLSEGCKINNVVLADFLNHLGIKKVFSKEDAKNQVDLINWCFRYYHEECEDYIFYRKSPSFNRKGITIAQYLEEFPDYEPEFRHYIPTPLQRCVINGYSTNFRFPKKLAQYIDKIEKPNLDNFDALYQFMDSIEKEVAPQLEEEEKYLSINHSFCVIDDITETETENDFKFVPKEKKFFTASLWNHRMNYKINDYDIRSIEIEIDERPPISKEEAMKYIGKDVLINWPNVWPAKVEKIVLGEEIIEEDLSVRKIPKGFVCEDIEQIISKLTGIKYQNASKIYFFVRPKVCISESRNLYMYRAFNKVIPLSMVIDVDSDDPIYRNFEPYEIEGEFGEGESVFIIPEHTRGTVEKEENGEFEVSYEKNTDLGKSPIKESEIEYQSKENLIKDFCLPNAGVLDYFIEKAGFRADKFSGQTKIPSTIAKTVQEIMKRKEVRMDSFKNETNHNSNESEIKKFKNSDLIWRGNYVREKTNLPYKGARVAFVGASGSIPFGTIGTVIKKHDISNYAIVEADDVIPFGFCHNKRVYRAYIGDLYVLREF